MKSSHRDTFRSSFGRSPVFNCSLCERKTRDTNSGNGDCDLCPQCFERCGIENTLSDDAAFYRANPDDKARLEARVAALTAEAIKQGGNRARLGA